MKYMKILWVVMSLCCVFSCRNSSSYDTARDGLENSVENMKAQWQADQKSEEMLDSLMACCPTRLIRYADSILYTKKLSSRDEERMRTRKAESLYLIDSISLAYKEFDTLYALDPHSPRYICGYGVCKSYFFSQDTALFYLRKAANINYDYYWQIGNYWEIQKNIDSASFCYLKLYNNDKKFYNYAKDRANAIKNGAALYTKIQITRKCIR